MHQAGLDHPRPPASSLEVHTSAEKEARRQRLAIKSSAIRAPDWRERSNHSGALGRDPSIFQLAGDLVTQRLGDIEVSVVYDARRSEEQIMCLQQLVLGPIEILECRKGVRDEVRRHDGLGPTVKWNSV